MQLHELQKSSGYTKKAKRLGRGNSNGKGNYSGKGMKGQNARAGGGVAPWFEGGQTPLYMRLPKLRGFKRYFKLLEEVQPINVETLEADERIASGSEISKASLVEFGYLSSIEVAVKILGNGDLKKSLKFVGIEGFSSSAQKKIESAGGSIEMNS